MGGKRVVICGSMLASSQMLAVAKELERSGHVVILPTFTREYATGRKTYQPEESAAEKMKHDLIRQYYQEIKESDAIVAVNIDKNGIANYVGANTLLEMAFAHVLNKDLYLLNPIPKMDYTSEIIALKPTILNGDLNKI